MNELTTTRIISLIDRKFEYMVSTESFQLFRYYRRLWGYLRTNAITNEILEKAVKSQKGAEFDVHNILNGNWTYFEDRTGGEQRDIAAFIKLNDALTDSNRSIDIGNLKNLGIQYSEGSHASTDMYVHIRAFCSLFLVPVIDYVKDGLGKNTAILTTLLRIKHRCEWFERAALLEKFELETDKGEKNFQRILYKNLFDEGIPLNIEPISPSGEIDFITSQKGDDRCYCEVKIYDVNRGKGKSYIVSGIRNQLLSYLNDYNEYVGYLIVFKTCEDSLTLDLPVDQGVNFIQIGSKKVYVLIIDVCKYAGPASKRKTPGSETISAADF